jgi:PEP-CTERM motif
MQHPSILAAAAAASLFVATSPALARVVNVQVTVENLSPTNSISFAPLRFGFHNGSFDSFNNGAAATAPIISVAEGGSGADWFPAFAAAEPGAVLGSTLGGAILPGATATSMNFRVNTAVNRYFTFGSMVVPSNDYFIGNDDPLEYQIFDANGNLLLGEIFQNASEIWDAGSEAFDPLNAAFLVGGSNGLRTAQNGVVSFDFLELAGFNGLQTAAGYTFDSQLQSATPVFRISFTSAAVPEPSSWAMLISGFGLIGTIARRRRDAATQAA